MGWNQEELKHILIYFLAFLPSFHPGVCYVPSWRSRWTYGHDFWHDDGSWVWHADFCQLTGNILVNVRWRTRHGTQTDGPTDNMQFLVWPVHRTFARQLVMLLWIRLSPCSHVTYRIECLSFGVLLLVSFCFSTRWQGSEPLMYCCMPDKLGPPGIRGFEYLNFNHVTEHLNLQDFSLWSSDHDTGQYTEFRNPL